ncbi:hypothetical protein [Sutcliffiella rhizosphaerae]|uniref:Uncharacterized protein n=1 Tax=Sutcliffiella rhizosphaerae TaxID=2880967 RepID=A0ABM8YTP7_9BACI|nr:hypothetical protein [Sutcliffiella rhizosphaerae]CAG9623340.1 hypothetical protein BACCIP111883_04141 [Sutcliffiella rhizosphaerae]
MDRRIQELVDLTKNKFGLEDYYLQRHGLSQNVNIYGDTAYMLWMEWFPSHETELEDEDTNPDGTAVIEINVHTRRFESAIFVMDKTYAENGITFANLKTRTIIEWIEEETGLTYNKHFQLHKESEGDYQFLGRVDGIPVSPSAFIDVTCNEAGKLLSFSVHGPFPTHELVKDESYTLSLEQIKQIAVEQLKLVELPSYEQNKLIPVYAVEEIFVANDGAATIPFEIIADVGAYTKIDEIIYWDEPSYTSFERQEISWSAEVSAAQAFSNEPSPVTYPISKEEEKECVTAVKDLLRQEYPNDTGKWIIATLQREKGYIHATLKANNQSKGVLQRKLIVMIDPNSLQAINYVDNKMMLEMYDSFQAAENVTITKEEAFMKIKEWFELKPYYVFDFEQKQYILCGKLDCQHGVNAATGEVILLADLDK